MALTLLNYLYWDIPEARIPFLIADAVVLAALHFIDRGLKAEKKLLQLQEHHADQVHEMDKEEKIAQRSSQRLAKQRVKNQKGNNGKTSFTGNAKNHHIQQPSKRD